ncbi:MAG: M48 family peptidase, partial [Coprobacter sp.]|nr:M48 family peptidase [Coprobacter sp.]
MEYNVIGWIILGFVVSEYAVQQLLSRLNRRAASPHLPPALAGLYDERQYAEQQRYFAINNRFASITDTVMTALVVLLLCTGFFGRMDAWVQTVFPGSLLWSTLFFFGLLFLASTILSLPFEIYDTFVIE